MNGRTVLHHSKWTITINHTFCMTRSHFRCTILKASHAVMCFTIAYGLAVLLPVEDTLNPWVIKKWVYDYASVNWDIYISAWILRPKNAYTYAKRCASKHVGFSGAPRLRCAGAAGRLSHDSQPPKIVRGMGAAYRPGRAARAQPQWQPRRRRRYRSGRGGAREPAHALTHGWWRRRRGMRRHAGTTPGTRRRARTPGAQTLQALRRYDPFRFAPQDLITNYFSKTKVCLQNCQLGWSNWTDMTDVWSLFNKLRFSVLAS